MFKEKNLIYKEAPSLVTGLTSPFARQRNDSLTFDGNATDLNAEVRNAVDSQDNNPLKLISETVKNGITNLYKGVKNIATGGINTITLPVRQAGKTAIEGAAQLTAPVAKTAMALPSAAFSAASALPEHAMDIGKTLTGIPYLISCKLRILSSVPSRFLRSIREKGSATIDKWTKKINGWGAKFKDKLAFN